MLAWAGIGRWWSAAGCPVGDQPGDGQVGLGVVLSPPDPALQPLLFADRLDRPVLIVHGTDDPNPPTQPE